MDCPSSLAQESTSPNLLQQNNKIINLTRNSLRNRLHLDNKISELGLQVRIRTLQQPTLLSHLTTRTGTNPTSIMEATKSWLEELVTRLIMDSFGNSNIRSKTVKEAVIQIMYSSISSWTKIYRVSSKSNSRLARRWTCPKDRTWCKRTTRKT